MFKSLETDKLNNIEVGSCDVTGPDVSKSMLRFSGILKGLTKVKWIGSIDFRDLNRNAGRV